MNEPENDEQDRQERPGYDPAKDVLISDIGRVALGTRRHLRVAIRSYNGGRPRIELVQSGTRKDGKEWTTPKVGRLDPAQAADLAALLVKAAFACSEEVASRSTQRASVTE